MTNTINLAANAKVSTSKASRYMKALCNHFDRKAEANYSEDKGSIVYSFGSCHMVAQADSLLIEVTAENDEDFDRVKRVVASHLIRFGQKDELQVDWR